MVLYPSSQPAQCPSLNKPNDVQVSSDSFAFCFKPATVSRLDLPEYFENISPVLRQFGVDTVQSLDDLTKVVYDNLEQSSKSIIKALMVFFGGLASAAFILTASFFLSLEDRAVERFLLLLCPAKYEDLIKNIFESVCLTCGAPKAQLEAILGLLGPTCRLEVAACHLCRPHTLAGVPF